MSKIWMVQFRGYNGRKYYKTEASFMEAINQHHDRAIVTIFEEVEQHNALEYKNNLITQRERENQNQKD
jgi:Tfp pilus assembly pilus retraction ATPase PilT